MTSDTVRFRTLLAGLILRSVGLALLGPAVVVALALLLSQ